MEEEKVVTANELVGHLLEFEEGERKIIADFIQSISLAHDLYLYDTEQKKSVDIVLEENGFNQDEDFLYWYYVMNVNILAWRVGSKKAKEILSGALFAMLPENDFENKTEFYQEISLTRESAEKVGDLLFGFESFESQEESVADA